MADLHTQFVTTLNVGSIANVQRAIELAEDFPSWHPDYENEESLAWLDKGFEVRAHSDDHDTLFIEDDSGEGSVENVIAFVKHLAKTFELSGRWGFEFANTCSKAQIGGFGGGAHVLDLGTQETVAWVDTTDWLNRKLVGATRTVWVVNISHRHGTNASVESSAAAAQEAVAAFAREWWTFEKVIDAVDGVTTAEEFEKAFGIEAMIDRYFQFVEDDDFEIVTAELED